MQKEDVTETGALTHILKHLTSHLLAAVLRAHPHLRDKGQGASLPLKTGIQTKEIGVDHRAKILPLQIIVEIQTPKRRVGPPNVPREDMEKETHLTDMEKVEKAPKVEREEKAMIIITVATTAVGKAPLVIADQILNLRRNIFHLTATPQHVLRCSTHLAAQTHTVGHFMVFR
jgi:hypothetical protein